MFSRSLPTPSPAKREGEGFTRIRRTCRQGPPLPLWEREGPAKREGEGFTRGRLL